MSDEPEKLTGPEELEPAAAQPETPPATPDESSLSDFRRALIEEDAEEAASNLKKGKKVSLIRRMTSMLSFGPRQTGSLNKPPEDQPAPDADSQASDPELEDKLAALIADTPTLTSIPSVLVPVNKTKDNLPDEPSTTAESAIYSINPDTGALREGDSQNDEIKPLELNPGQMTVGKPPEQSVLEVEGSQAGETEEQENGSSDLLEGVQGDVAAVELTHPSADEKTGSDVGSAASPGPERGGEEAPQVAPGAAQTRPASSLRRLVTSFLMPQARRKIEDEPPEEMGDDEIVDRLKASLALTPDQTLAQDSPSAQNGERSVRGSSATASTGVGQPATGTAGQSSSASPAAGPTQPVEEIQDLSALWGPYASQVSVPAETQPASPMPPPPFVEEPIDYQDLDSDDLSDPSKPRPPFIKSDTGWLGDLRDSVQNEPLVEPEEPPEIETPSEKSDIWDHLVSEPDLEEKKPSSAASFYSSPSGAVEPGEEAPELDVPEWNKAAFPGLPGSGPDVEKRFAQGPSAETDSEDGSTPENKFEQAPDAEEEATPGSSSAESSSAENYGDWYGGYEKGDEDFANTFGLPEPSKESSDLLKETTKLYESIFEDQKQQELRAVLLEDMPGEPDASDAGAPGTPYYNEELPARPKSWWARIGLVQRVMIIIAVVLFLSIMVLIGSSFLPGSAPRSGVVVQSTAVDQGVSSIPAGVYPIGVELTGGWIFSLDPSTMVNGHWQPKGGEWLNGTVVRRVIALPWSRQIEAVVKSFAPGDEIRLIFNNKQTIVYKVSEVKQVAVSDTSVLTDTRPSVAIILYQPNSTQRWVVIAAQ